MTTHNLPTFPTPFIGRADEIAELSQLLDNPDCRLLTLVGPGGIGKTRLAVEVARCKNVAFADGVYFVALQTVDSSDNFIGAMADALIPQLKAGDDPQQLRHFLHDKHMLFILDNFEHLLDAVDSLSEILSTTSQLKFMTTSRIRLNLQAEHIWLLNGLDVPDEIDKRLDQHSAVQLFVERATRVSPLFSLREQRAAVVRICRLVDGSPLALELAAVWTGTMMCQAIADEIQRSIDFLMTSQHDVSERHQSMRAVFDHSWHLLTEHERDVFRKLPIFHGGFTAEAAAQVAGASRLTLAALVNKSLVQMTSDGRYDMHTLLRQYGEERLAEVITQADETRLRHARYFTDYMTQNYERMFQDLDQDAVYDVRAEIANIEAAALWRLQHEVMDDLGKYAAVAALFYQGRSLLNYGERILHMWAGLARTQPASAERDQALGGVLTYLAWIIHLQSRHEDAIPVLEEGLSLLEQSRAQVTFAHALAFLGRVYRSLGQFERAIALLQQSFSLAEATNSNMAMWTSLGHLSETAFDMGNYDEAQRYVEEALDKIRTSGNFGKRFGVAVLGLIHATKGEIGPARKRLLEAIRENRDVPDALSTSFFLAGMAVYLMALGQDDKAAEVLSIFVNHPITDTEMQDKMRPHLARLQASLPPEVMREVKQHAESAITAAQRSGAGVIFLPAYFDQLVDWLESHPVITLLDANLALAEPLSPRELEILTLIAKGLTNQKIADQLFVGVSTVKKHINHIFSKLDVKHRAEAVARARALKILP